MYYKTQINYLLRFLSNFRFPFQSSADLCLSMIHFSDLLSWSSGCWVMLKIRQDRLLVVTAAVNNIIIPKFTNGFMAFSMKNSLSFIQVLNNCGPIYLVARILRNMETGLWVINHFSKSTIKCLKFIRTFYNLRHNILKLFNILAKFSFTTSKLVLHMLHNKQSIQVASRVAEQLKTSQEISKYQEKVKIGWRQSLMPCLPSVNNTFVITFKIARDHLSKFSIPVQYFLTSSPFITDMDQVFLAVKV